jgi:hypothetical protein
MARAKKEVAVHEPAGMLAERPDFAGTGRGSETVQADDLVIPRLQLIQDLSPQRKRNDDEYIDGAEEGMMFNTVTRQLYPEGVVFVPTLFRKEHVIWKDREAGGGFRGAFSTAGEANAAKNELEDGAQCEIQETAQQFGLIVHPDNSTEQIVISMARSQMTPSRQLNSMVAMAEADRWARAYRVSSKVVSGPKGDYFNYKIDPIGWVNEDIYAAGEKMYEAVSSGMADVQRDADSSVTDDDM